ncbi:3-dehydroquinate synthase [Taibaiella sp. KBW10]|uniref:3-dehydroquinate synthase n=1 Tax=Taibaiella sp. KBW10 TaxID=2153357 RepID=UPI000F5A0F0F|nr:3-dehydroquinate synthase family protein [Taibaiella sp. KBW10]RQO31858.1 3-dehydroquinate synthase [Taibaiella sp. KBW10]
MHTESIAFSQAATQFYFEASWAHLKDIVEEEEMILLTDSHLFALYPKLFANKKTIVIPAGESAKSFSVLENAVLQLLTLQADRQSFLVGIGGGVVTDFTGFLAGIYKRGIRFGFLPTSILGMVDAAIGGKNGLDIGVFKNMVGLTRQPEFILYDYSFLQTLPREEWINGFAEIIKHAAILSTSLFDHIAAHKLTDFQEKPSLLSALIYKNVMLKVGVVQGDEFEKAERKQLNFGHTLAHAIENEYQLSHGHAVSIGMYFAAKLSAQLLHFNDSERLKILLEQYHLPVHMDFDSVKVLSLMKTDKKTNKGTVDYVLLETIGQARIYQTDFNIIEQFLAQQ